MGLFSEIFTHHGCNLDGGVSSVTRDAIVFRPAPPPLKEIAFGAIVHTSRYYPPSWWHRVRQASVRVIPQEAPLDVTPKSHSIVFTEKNN